MHITTAVSYKISIQYSRSPNKPIGLLAQMLWGRTRTKCWVLKMCKFWLRMYGAQMFWGWQSCWDKFLMKDNKVFIFISSVLEAKPTFAYTSSLLKFYFVRMIILIDCWKSHNPLMKGLGFSCHTAWFGCGTIFLFFLNFPFRWHRFSFGPGKDGWLLSLVYTNGEGMAAFGGAVAVSFSVLLCQCGCSSDGRAGEPPALGAEQPQPCRWPKGIPATGALAGAQAC